AADALQQNNEKLEATVRERMAEVVAAYEQLSSQNLEREWANQALEHQLRYNQLIVNSVNDLVFVLTKALNITRINPSVTHHTAHQETDVISKPLADFVRMDA